MDNDKILEMLYAALNDQDIWFTTKKDPTFAEASSYYKLDEFGNLTKEAQKQVAKDINSYIGDGALDIIEAIDMWINDNLNAYKIAYKDNLVTKFKQAPVVDNIDAYEVKLESKLIESNNKQLIDISKKLFDQNHQLLVSSKEDVVNILNQINDDYIKNELIKWFYSKLNKDYSLKDAAFSTDSYMWGFINGDYKSPESAESYNNENLEHWIEYAQLGLNKGQSEDEIYMDILDQTGNSDLANDVIDSLDNLEENLNKKSNCNLKTESVRTRMQEQNTKSANVISVMFTDPDFDADSKEGQIVMKTSELFNVLSEEGYDVQVFFDNGESQNVILLGDQGGQLNITITDANQPLRIYSSGNYEITQDNIKILQDVLNIVKKVR